MTFVNSAVVNEFGINLASGYITNRPAPFNERKGRTPSWGLSYGNWRAFRIAISTGEKPATVCSTFMNKAGRDPNDHNIRGMCYQGVNIPFPGQTVNTMRSTNKLLKLQGIRL